MLNKISVVELIKPHHLQLWPALVAATREEQPMHSQLHHPQSVREIVVNLIQCGHVRCNLSQLVLQKKELCCMPVHFSPGEIVDWHIDRLGHD